MSIPVRRLLIKRHPQRRRVKHPCSPLKIHFKKEKKKEEETKKSDITSQTLMRTLAMLQEAASKEQLSLTCRILLHINWGPLGAGEKNTVGCHGVRRVSRDSKSYQASVYVKNLVIYSRATKNLENAVELHAALMLLRHHFLENTGEDDVCEKGGLDERVKHLEAIFNVGIVHVRNEMGLCDADLGLSFRTLVAAYSEIGRQISSHLTRDLTGVLKQRERLLAAKREGWTSLRAEWVNILSRVHGDGAQAIADSVWESRAKARETAELRAHAAKLRAEQRLEARRARTVARSGSKRVLSGLERLALSASRLERAVVAEKRAADLALLRSRREEQRIKRRRLAAQRRWEKDPSRTMEEIMRGPPPEIE